MVRMKGPFPENVKQVIVLRVRYPDGNGGTRKVRSGKLVAQGAHASMLWLVKRVKATYGDSISSVPYKMSAYSETKYSLPAAKSSQFSLTPEEGRWLNEKFTKICLCVDTEEELLDIHHRALEAGLTSELVKDAGDTEFGGEETHTAIAIGPHGAAAIDAITGHLRLY